MAPAASAAAALEGGGKAVPSAAAAADEAADEKVHAFECSAAVLAYGRAKDVASIKLDSRFHSLLLMRGPLWEPLQSPFFGEGDASSGAVVESIAATAPRCGGCLLRAHVVPQPQDNQQQPGASSLLATTPASTAGGAAGPRLGLLLRHLHTPALTLATRCGAPHLLLPPLLRREIPSLKLLTYPASDASLLLPFYQDWWNRQQPQQQQNQQQAKQQPQQEQWHQQPHGGVEAGGAPRKVDGMHASHPPLCDLRGFVCQLTASDVLQQVAERRAAAPSPRRNTKPQQPLPAADAAASRPASAAASPPASVVASPRASGAAVVAAVGRRAAVVASAVAADSTPGATAVCAARADAVAAKKEEKQQQQDGGHLVGRRKRQLCGAGCNRSDTAAHEDRVSCKNSNCVSTMSSSSGSSSGNSSGSTSVFNSSNTGHAGQPGEPRGCDESRRQRKRQTKQGAAGEDRSRETEGRGRGGAAAEARGEAATRRGGAGGTVPGRTAETHVQVKTSTGKVELTGRLLVAAAAALQLHVLTVPCEATQQQQQQQQLLTPCDTLDPKSSYSSNCSASEGGTDSQSTNDTGKGCSSDGIRPHEEVLVGQGSPTQQLLQHYQGEGKETQQLQTPGPEKQREKQPQQGQQQQHPLQRQLEQTNLVGDWRWCGASKRDRKALQTGEDLLLDVLLRLREQGQQCVPCCSAVFCGARWACSCSGPHAPGGRSSSRGSWNDTLDTPAVQPRSSGRANPRDSSSGIILRSQHNDVTINGGISSCSRSISQRIESSSDPKCCTDAQRKEVWPCSGVCCRHTGPPYVHGDPSSLGRQQETRGSSSSSSAAGTAAGDTGSPPQVTGSAAGGCTRSSLSASLLLPPRIPHVIATLQGGSSVLLREYVSKRFQQLLLLLSPRRRQQHELQESQHQQEQEQQEQRQHQQQQDPRGCVVLESTAATAGQPAGTRHSPCAAACGGALASAPAMSAAVGEVFECGVSGVCVGGISAVECLAERHALFAAAVRHVPVSLPRFVSLEERTGGPVEILHAFCCGADVVEAAAVYVHSREGLAYAFNPCLLLERGICDLETPSGEDSASSRSSSSDCARKRSSSSDDASSRDGGRRREEESCGGNGGGIDAADASAARVLLEAAVRQRGSQQFLFLDLNKAIYRDDFTPLSAVFPSSSACTGGSAPQDLLSACPPTCSSPCVSRKNRSNTGLIGNSNNTAGGNGSDRCHDENPTGGWNSSGSGNHRRSSGSNSSSDDKRQHRDNVRMSVSSSSGIDCSRSTIARGSTVGETRAYIHHLLQRRELSGPALLLQHNLQVLEALTACFRVAMQHGRLLAFVKGFLTHCCDPSPPSSSAAAS